MTYLRCSTCRPQPSPCLNCTFEEREVRHHGRISRLTRLVKAAIPLTDREAPKRVMEMPK